VRQDCHGGASFATVKKGLGKGRWLDKEKGFCLPKSWGSRSRPPMVLETRKVEGGNSFRWELMWSGRGEGGREDEEGHE